jgi:hypothetical protein
VTLHGYFKWIAVSGKTFQHQHTPLDAFLVRRTKGKLCQIGWMAPNDVLAQQPLKTGVLALAGAEYIETLAPRRPPGAHLVGKSWL